MSSTKTEPKRPTELLIGYIPFTVTYLSHEEWAAQGFPDSDAGQTDGSAGKITIRTPAEQHPIHAKEILLHEVLHACMYACQLTIEGNLHAHGDIEETIVGRVSPVLLQTLRANPELASFLQS